MKIAQLHNGDELYFPDDYDDEKMDEMVEKYIALMNAKASMQQAEEMKLLRQSIESGITKIATIMAAPKELVRDWQDKPVGVKPKI